LKSVRIGFALVTSQPALPGPPAAHEFPAVRLPAVCGPPLFLAYPYNVTPVPAQFQSPSEPLTTGTDSSSHRVAGTSPVKQAFVTMTVSSPHQVQECTRGHIACRGQRKGLPLTSNQCLDWLSHFRGPRHTVYSWARQKLIPHTKLGRLIRFELDELRQFLDRIKGQESTKSGRYPEELTPRQPNWIGNRTKRGGCPQVAPNLQKPAGED